MAVRGERIHRGKVKALYLTDDPQILMMVFSDEVTALDGKKRDVIAGKGRVNAAVSAHFFRVLQEAGVPNHFVDTWDDHTLLVRRVEIIPVEVVVRNVAAGSICRRLGLSEGISFSRPVVELYYKRDDLGDPLINRDHAIILGLAEEDELALMQSLALRVNAVLRPHVRQRGMELVDFKLEFGRSPAGILVADEISPDTCRFWDLEAGEKLDKDRFRQDLGGVIEAYSEVLKRLTGR